MKVTIQSLERKIIKLSRGFNFILICLLMTSCSQLKKPLLHVPSPDWRDQIVYFVMIDRFDDGDKNNNDQGYELYNPLNIDFYSGGDIQGITRRIDYIKNLGATAVWLTPPVANLWYSPHTKSTGYHGYWARDFKSVDERFGTLDSYKLLSENLHENGMYLIQDIVANHVGNYFYYDGEYNPENTSENFKIVEGNLPGLAPTQFPFNKIDRNNQEHYESSIYHWTPEINDFYDPVQEFTYQLSELSDLNTSNPVVRKTLKQSLGYWIEEVGVDAFRLDTAKYLDPEFLGDLLHSEKGLLATAASTGRNHFPVFGELFETSLPYSDTAEKKFLKFQGTDDKPILNGLIGFPLYKSIEEVFRSGQPTRQISYRLKKQMELYRNPYMVLNFLDNHDVKRFHIKGNTQAFQQALAFIMTIPGIPVIYQGDEQGLFESREAMFAGGYHAEKDKFNQNSDLYLHIKNLSKIRKTNKALTRGTIEILADNDLFPGILAFKRTYQGESVIVLFNTAENKILASNIPLDLNVGQSLSMLFAENITNVPRPDKDGNISISMNARSTLILGVNNTNEIVRNSKPAISINIDNMKEGEILTEDRLITGTSSLINSQLLFVEDDNLQIARKINTDNIGNWSEKIKVENYGKYRKSIELHDPKTKVSSQKIHYQTHRLNPDISIKLEDAIGDDVGPSGDYIKPLEKTYDSQMDIVGVAVAAGGKILELSIKMKELRTDWIAANGFDHVSFSIFFDTPDKDGLDELPLLLSKTPPNFSWTYSHHLFGWGNTLYSAEGADETHRGKPISTSPKIKVEIDNKTITITYNADQFNMDSWQGSKIYISTWGSDGEGHNRDIQQLPSRWSFASKTKHAPYILDDITPIYIN